MPQTFGFHDQCLQKCRRCWWQKRGFSRMEILLPHPKPEGKQIGLRIAFVPYHSVFQRLRHVHSPTCFKKSIFLLSAFSSVNSGKGRQWAGVKLSWSFPFVYGKRVEEANDRDYWIPCFQSGVVNFHAHHSQRLFRFLLENPTYQLTVFERNTADDAEDWDRSWREFLWTLPSNSACFHSSTGSLYYLLWSSISDYISPLSSVSKYHAHHLVVRFTSPLRISPTNLSPLNAITRMTLRIGRNPEFSSWTWRINESCQSDSPFPVCIWENRPRSRGLCILFYLSALSSMSNSHAHFFNRSFRCAFARRTHSLNQSFIVKDIKPFGNMVSADSERQLCLILNSHIQHNISISLPSLKCYSTFATSCSD